MKLRHVRAVLGVLLVLSCTTASTADDAPADPIGDFFDSIKADVKKRLEEKRAAQQESAHAPVELDVLATAVEAHDYEGALRPEDYTCATIVEPFTLEKNVAGLFGESDLIGLLALFQSPDKTTLLEVAKRKARRVNWIPMAFERSYGARLHQQKITLDRKFIARSDAGRVKRQYAKADALLQQVLAAIGEPHPYEFKLFLLNSSMIQGHAAPGGYLYLTTAALESDYADLVLAHEIAHVLKRHQTRELQAQLIDTVTTFDELKALMDLDKVPEKKYARRLLQLSGSYLNFSRQQELQADACSVRIAGMAAGIDLRHRIAGYASELEKATGGDPRDRLFSLHAGYPERYRRMEAVAIGMEKERRDGR